MTSTRLLGIVGTLWFFFAIMEMFVASISPMGIRILLPERHPATWIASMLLFGTPILILSQRFAPPKVAGVLSWITVAGLGFFVVALFAFLAAMFVGH